MEDKSMYPALGRARGRGRANVEGSAQSRPGDPQHSTAGSVWGQPGPSSHSQIRPAAPTVPFQAQGRATLHRAVDIPTLTESTGRADVMRGAMRGRRIVHDIIKTRPENLNTKRGETGRPVQLTANYFKLLHLPTWGLHQYHVDFMPNIEMIKERKIAIRAYKEHLGGFLFDGTMLFSTQKLATDPTFFVFNTENGEAVQIQIKYVNLLSMNDGHSTHILNLILRRALEGLKLQLIGRNFFDARAKTEIPDFQLQLWPGYTTSIRQHEQDILMCAEITHKVMRMETVYALMYRLRNNDLFAKTIIGQVIMTDYNNRTYRIDDVDFNSNPTKTFPTRDGNAMSYIVYYKQKYKINIRDIRQPMLLSRAKARDIRSGHPEFIALVPELCRLTGTDENMRSNFPLMQAMGKHTRVGPDARRAKLLDFNRRLHSTKESMDVLQEWNMDLDQKLVEICGRELKRENIVLGSGKRAIANEAADWTSEFRYNRLFQTIPLKRWIVLSPNKCMKESSDFARLIYEVGRGLGFDVSQPKIIPLNDDRPQAYIQEIERACNQDPQLLMCVVPNNRADRYSAIKKKCCVQRAVPTQVMVQRTITPRGGNTRGLMSIATKVAIQMNCKLGCAPWMIEMPVKGLMTIGFDVCHDAQDKAISYGALVATMDVQISDKFFSTVSAHRSGEELSNELSINVMKAVVQFRNMHNALPAKILFYRDGVGEGQVHYVVEHELTNLRTKLEEKYKEVGAELKMAFIIVTKRLNTRIFARNGNPSPGTIIDDVITLPERYDFYIVSQSVKQGTVSPTNYNVIYDNMGLNPDRLQQLTYKMTHLYYNWSGTTRVPAVCQYAHKLAFLVSQFIHQAPSNLLEKQLYFL